MQHIVLENLLVILSQATGILINMIAVVVGFLLGAFVFLWMDGWRPIWSNVMYTARAAV